MERTTSFGYWLRRRRKALDLTQDEMARQVGCAAGTIRKIEADERRPSRQLAERLADLLAISLEERPAFLKAARAELATDQLDIAAQPLASSIPTAHAAALLTGTVTFLFTDIEDSTKLWAEHPEMMRLALARHDALLRRAIEAHGGMVFKTVGDSCYAAFATAADALATAAAAQRDLTAEAWNAAGPLPVRMALHTGAAEVREGDYFGHTLNRVARLLNAGHGGQILLSAATWELLRDHLPPDVALRDLGAHWLKSLARPEQIYQLAAPGLSADFPPLHTLDRPTTNLPAQPTALIGREREVAAVREMLHRSGVRLVTLTGPGGTGKTRLGLQVAGELLDDWPDGVWFVNLAPLSDPGLLAATIAQTFSLREIGGQPIEAILKSYLRAKRLLLLLDNFEQIAEAAPLISELLAAAPGLTVLVTSRAPLHLSGEREYAVPPLGLPPFERSNVQTITQYEAVRLFIERAQAVKADFVMTKENAPAVAEICYRLDGLPLAIELAAARIKLFPPQALLARLGHRLTLLTGGARDLPHRQQTIRNTIEWSYNLLDVGEQRLFARLGVFVGGCTIEAVEAVCNADTDMLMEVVGGIAALLDQSLLRQEEGVGGEPRYTMLETIREYGLERLAANGQVEIVKRQHASYFVGLAEKIEPQLYGSEQVRWLDQLDQEHSNLRAALYWTIKRRETDLALRLGSALGWFWSQRAHWRESLRWLEAALAQGDNDLTPTRAYALFYAGILAPDPGRQSAWGEESLALFRALGDKPGIARVLPYLGQWVRDQGNTARAEALFAEHVVLGQELGDLACIGGDPLYSMMMLEELWGNYAALLSLAEEGLAQRRRLGDPMMIAAALNALGEAARLLGDDDRAMVAFTEALSLFRELRTKDGAVGILTNMAFVVQRQGDHARAATLFGEALAVWQELELPGGTILALAGLAGVAAVQAQAVRAARLLGTVEAWYEMNGFQMQSTDRADYERIVATVRAQLDATTFAAEWAAGRALTLEQAVAEALAAYDMAPGGRSSSQSI